MISYDKNGFSFNYRVVGVALHEGRVLLHRAEFDDFWALPGGRCEVGESASDALRREMREELGVEVRVERLLWVVENFFQYAGRSFHELGLYFLMSFPDNPELYAMKEAFVGYEDFYELQEGRFNLIYQWVPLCDLEDTRVYPSFLKQRLMALPEHTEHLLHVDEE